jgi:glutathione peroxidase
MNIYDFKVKDAQGSEKTLADYQGNVLLIVNVASKCGHTPQYAGLQELFSKYKDRGFLVLGFPCNQFGLQEPGTDAEIQSFCQLNYGVTFPVFSKIEVNGENAHPLYRYLTSQKESLKGSSIQWNFEKFLVDRSGSVVERCDPAVKPEAVSAKIEALLQNS